MPIELFDSLEGRKVGQSFDSPTVYLDHWAIRLFSDDRILQDRLVTALLRKRGATADCHNGCQRNHDKYGEGAPENKQNPFHKHDHGARSRDSQQSASTGGFTMSTVYYFAYGSNLHPVRLEARVPSARAIGTVELLGLNLAFHKRSRDLSAKCLLYPERPKSEKVYGVLYAFDDVDKGALDHAEGLGQGYFE
jgi:hypothetical protein